MGACCEFLCCCSLVVRELIPLLLVCLLAWCYFHSTPKTWEILQQITFLCGKSVCVLLWTTNWAWFGKIAYFFLWAEWKDLFKWNPLVVQFIALFLSRIFKIFATEILMNFHAAIWMLFYFLMKWMEKISFDKTSHFGSDCEKNCWFLFIICDKQWNGTVKSAFK
jgi:hypothetical protein